MCLGLCACAHASNAPPRTVRASWYGGGERLSRHTANGERFNPRAMTAAHRSLPFGTRLALTNPANGRTVVVRVTDRGPAASTGRALDLSRGAAAALGMLERGTGSLTMRVLP
ncbi:septal ring lytic transglycosylase RlpA family protein [Methylovirgula sp. 4M-Z18]|uniref:septal ring lytic transglycosylase RlpA family protein n=1 Tax=Methylovirgula sp. 4M-Z18 TaxID=2293567 RepID=UPI000E2ED898|nr:septal ring lytic transglycosylase RlpA family protein [Methylovirgula sp. 4M-Z18]RFB80386.1 septal ring lytic transglycosylase RlpA family protein [Methylovirgula sp. 4M-Z18]